MKKIALSLAFAAALSTAHAQVPYFPQTLPSGTVVGRLSTGPGPTEAISMAALLNALFPGGSAAFNFNASSVVYQGSVTGAVTTKAQAGAGTYTLFWPNTVGTSNFCLVESVSGTNVTLSFQGCARLTANNAFSGNNTHSGIENFTSTFQIGGTTQNFPASGNLVGTTDTQTISGKSIDAGQLTGTIAAGRMPALTGDCTTTAGAVATTCTKTNGVTFAASATTDTTNAANISSNQLAYARLPTFAKTQSTPGNKSITATNATQMMGMAGSITPSASGNVLVMVRSDMAASTAGACTFTIRFGTGAAPTNGAAATGTSVGSSSNPNSGTGPLPTTLVGYISGLTPSTAYWIDVSGGATGTSITCQANNNTVVAIEE